MSYFSDRRPHDDKSAGHHPARSALPFAPGQGGSPQATHAQVDRVGELLGELMHLVDESIRCVDASIKTLDAGAVASHAALRKAEQHLHEAAHGLDTMSELVHAAMQNAGQSLGSPHLQRSRPVTLGEAIQHAADVCKPLADGAGVALRVHVATELAHAPSGAIYTVALNAIQNAIEAIQRRAGTGRATGTVEVDLRPEAAPQDATKYGRDDRLWAVLDVRDDGCGLPKGGDGARCFNLGFTTKAGGAGVGLAVARSVVQGMGGMIQLRDRKTDVPDGPAGCLLRVQFPLLAMPQQFRHSA